VLKINNVCSINTYLRHAGNQKSKCCRGGEDRAIIVAINSNCPHFLFKSLCSWACLHEVFESNLNHFIFFMRQLWPLVNTLQTPADGMIRRIEWTVLSAWLEGKVEKPNPDTLFSLTIGWAFFSKYLRTGHWNSIKQYVPTVNCYNNSLFYIL
jgi:hypothetical protein